jgi:hypothetical protein
LLKKLSKFGFKLKSAFYFERRGDFGENRYKTILPSFFYEYLIIIKKIADAKFNEVCDIIISDKFSKTFSRVGGSVDGW